jgi:hypothetical protein
MKGALWFGKFALSNIPRITIISNLLFKLSLRWKLEADPPFPDLDHNMRGFIIPGDSHNLLLPVLSTRWMVVGRMGVERSHLQRLALTLGGREE